MTNVVENKKENINLLKEEKKKYEQLYRDLKMQNERNMKEIEYLINENNELKKGHNICDNDNEIDKMNLYNPKDYNIEYYEKQLNDSNNTIKRMGDMIKELEKQIEELQKEMEENNYENKYNNKELLDIIKKKDKEIKQYKMQIQLFTEEKNKLYEDNTKMYNDLDRFQKYIYDLSQQNKKLSEQINKYDNNNNNTNININMNDHKASLLFNKKEIDLNNEENDEVDDIKNNLDIKTVMESNNFDDINKNNLSDINIDSLLKSSNNINMDDNKKYNGLTDNELNDNQNILNTYNNEIKNKNYYRPKKNKHRNNDEEKNQFDLYFNYDSKDAGELSDD